MSDENLKNYVIVPPSGEIQVGKILEDIGRVDAFIPDFSKKFETHLVGLDLEINVFSDLVVAQTTHRTLMRMVDNFYDLRENADLLKTLKLTTEFLDQTHQLASFLVDHFYWRSFEVFCENICLLVPLLDTDDFSEKFAAESKFTAIFFPEMDTEDLIRKQFKKISLLFHQDRVRADSQLLAHDVFTAVTRFKETLLLTMGGEFKDEDEKIREYNLRAKECYDQAHKFNKAYKCKIGQATSTSREIDDLMTWSESELKANRKLFSEKACNYYRSAIRSIDKLAITKPLQYLNQQIGFRESIAVSFYLGGFQIEAQLYIVAAIHLALKLQNSAERIIGLQKTLSTIVKGNKIKLPTSSEVSSPLSPTSVVEGDVMSTALVVASEGAISQKFADNERARENFNKKVKEATKSFLLNNTIRANTALVEYQTPQEKIVEVRKAAAVYTTGGVILKGAGVTTLTVVPTAVLASTILTAEMTVPAVISALATVTTGGAAGIILACLLTWGGFYYGGQLYSSGQRLELEPVRREQLNEIMKDAVALYSEGRFEEMFSALSRQYVDERLLIFEPGRQLRFFHPEMTNETANIQVDEPPRTFVTIIIEKLLKHGFRADGVALVLHIISEGLICADLKLPEAYSRRVLLSEAKKIILELETSKLLTEDAQSLDNLIFQAKSRLFQQTTQNFSAYYRGIPSSFVKDAQIAPFVARLEEIRIVSLINKVILYIIDDDEERYILENVAKIRRSINRHFQYFSVSNFRLEALEDFLIAKGIYFDEPEPSNDSQQPRKAEGDNTLKTITDVPEKSQFLWGNNPFDCYNIFSQQGLTMFQLLSNVTEYSFQSHEDLLQHIASAINIENRRYQDLQSIHPEFPVDEPQILYSLRDFRKKVRDQLNATVPFIRDNALLLKEIFGIDFIICEKSSSKLTDNVKALYVLSEQSFNLEAKDFSKLYCVCKDDPVVFQVSPKGEKPIILLEAAVNFQLARKNLKLAGETHNLTTMVKSMRYYEMAAKYFQNALSCLDASWNFSVFGLYQFVEYRALMNAVGRFREKAAYFFPKRVWTEEEIDSILGLMECYTGSFKYAKTLELVRVCLDKQEVKSHHLFWYWYAVAARKSTYYYDAAYAVQKSLEISHQYRPTITERKVVQKLNEREISGTVREFVDTYLRYDRKLDVNVPAVKRKFYDVLSIDGGGVKGIIPAYWLGEIEKRAHTPISNLYRMIAGTSTGSIIAGALSVNQRTANIPIAASELVHLYSDPNLLQDVFCRRFSLGGLIGAKYNDNRSKVIQMYVGEHRLTDTLVDLVVPSVNVAFTHETHAFSSFAARASPHENFRLVDALMASSAAPTYFQSYNVENTFYVDGGMQANNPSKIAYDAAVGNNQNNIRIWSLGTGDYIAPQDANPKNGIVFWAKNAYETAVGSQQGQIDKDLSERIGGNYNRWQVWLHEPIVLDSYQQSNVKDMVEHARQFIEEADASDDNPINRCVESLLHNNEQF